MQRYYKIRAVILTTKFQYIKKIFIRATLTVDKPHREAKRFEVFDKTIPNESYNE